MRVRWSLILPILLLVPTVAFAQTGFDDITDRFTTLQEWLERLTWIVSLMSAVAVVAKFVQGDPAAFRQALYWVGGLSVLMAARGIVEFFQR